MTDFTRFDRAIERLKSDIEMLSDPERLAKITFNVFQEVKKPKPQPTTCRCIDCKRYRDNRVRCIEFRRVVFTSDKNVDIWETKKKILKLGYCLAHRAPVLDPGSEHEIAECKFVPAK